MSSGGAGTSHLTDRVVVVTGAGGGFGRLIIHAIDQPWGVVISDVTVRATGENYVI